MGVVIMWCIFMLIVSKNGLEKIGLRQRDY